MNCGQLGVFGPQPNLMPVIQFLFPFSSQSIEFVPRPKLRGKRAAYSGHRRFVLWTLLLIMFNPRFPQVSTTTTTLVLIKEVDVGLLICLGIVDAEKDS